MMAIFCMPDHLHMLVGFRPTQSMADLMKEVKSKSTDVINGNRLTNEHFHWQEGYGAFSHSRSHVPQVIQYILHQPEHHKQQSFKDEYLDLLKRFEVPFEERYLFDWLVGGTAPTEPGLNINQCYQAGAPMEPRSINT